MGRDPGHLDLVQAAQSFGKARPSRMPSAMAARIQTGRKRSMSESCGRGISGAGTAGERQSARNPSSLLNARATGAARVSYRCPSIGGGRKKKRATPPWRVPGRPAPATSRPEPQGRATCARGSTPRVPRREHGDEASVTENLEGCAMVGWARSKRSPISQAHKADSWPAIRRCISSRVGSASAFRILPRGALARRVGAGRNVR